MKTIDGGSGGGQIVRSALSLSGVTGTPVRIEDIRGNRATPGLKHQHLACVAAAAAVCDADVDGAELESETLEFDPADPVADSPTDTTPDSPTDHEVAVDVGTAGAIPLVFETVLPFVVVIDEPLSVTVTGGTDVAWSPSLAYYERVRLPLVRQFGWHASVTRHRRGFYPEGDGKATLSIEPSASRSATLTQRGAFRGARIDAVASADLADADVPQRLADAASEPLTEADVPVRETTAHRADAPSTGASVLVALVYEHTIAGFSALGEPGKPAETVGAAAAEDALAFHDAETRPVVDEYAADQVVLPLALAGGRVHGHSITDHVQTNAAVTRKFGFDVQIDEDVIVGRRPYFRE